GVTAQYVWSPVYVDALVERDAGGQRLYVQQDANFNVTGVVGWNPTLAIWEPKERYVYDPYGKPTDQSGQNVGVLTADWTFGGACQFNWVYLHKGGRWDTASGLYNFRNRDLSPTLGRWMQADPIGYQENSYNLYQNQGNSPTNFLDPDGMSIWD